MSNSYIDRLGVSLCCCEYGLPHEPNFEIFRYKEFYLGQVCKMKGQWQLKTNSSIEQHLILKIKDGKLKKIIKLNSFSIPKKSAPLLESKL